MSKILNYIKTQNKFIGSSKLRITDVRCNNEYVIILNESYNFNELLCYISKKTKRHFKWLDS